MWWCRARRSAPRWRVRCAGSSRRRRRADGAVDATQRRRYLRAMDPWTFAHAAWDEHFQPLRDAGLVLERVEPPVYWETHERALRAHFPPEVFFDLRALRPAEVTAAQARIAEARGGAPLYNFCVARAGGEIAAMFSGH